MNCDQHFTIKLRFEGSDYARLLIGLDNTHYIDAARFVELMRAVCDAVALADEVDGEVEP